MAFTERTRETHQEIRSLYDELNKIGNIIQEELFPLIGIPQQTFVKGYKNIPENLKSISIEMRKVISETKEIILQTEATRKQSRTQLNKILLEKEQQILDDLSQLFEQWHS